MCDAQLQETVVDPEVASVDHTDALWARWTSAGGGATHVG